MRPYTFPKPFCPRSSEALLFYSLFNCVMDIEAIGELDMDMTSSAASSVVM